ncbi:MAG: DUF6575 domain-containing protein [Leptolyngbyaceae cyanobacterium bins.302]|nr:DUF6575 domain-containing protein [Leptolyngbyaceae cyanobacterium bins.302]
MSLLPQETILGKLEILEVYEFYDKPCLFSCRNVAGQIFLAIWIDETSYSDSWLYVPTSLRRLQQIITGGMELKSAFLEAEDGFVFEVIIAHDEGSTDILRISCDNLDEDKLPAPGEFLSCQSQIVTSLVEKKNAKHSAIQLRRAVLNLAFSFPGMNVMQASAVDLGNLLQSTQYLIDALGQFRAGQPTVKGSIPNRIIQQTKLAVAGTFVSSFGIEMVAFEQPDLWGNSLVEEAIEAFLQLIKIGKDSERLREFLLDAQPRAASRYRIFLEKIILAKAKVRAEWGSFNQDKGDSAELLLADAKIVLGIVSQVEAEKPKQYEVEGELVGVNKRTKSFEIWEVKGEKKKYSGRILDSALSIAETATLSEIYTATIKEVTEVSLTGEEKTKYQLATLKINETEKKNRKS